MNRIDFISGIAMTPQVFPNDALTHDKIMVYLDGKLVPGVKSATFHVDLTYGYIVASIETHRVDVGLSRQMGRTTFAVNGYQQPIVDVLNPKMEKDTLILESIENDGKRTHFNLRTIIVA